MKQVLRSILINHSALALFSGVVSVFAFAPYHLYPLALVGLIGLLVSFIYSNSNQQAMMRGFLFGLGYFGLGMYWVSISIYQFGEAPIIIAGLLTLLLIIVLASIPALVGYCFTRFYPYNNLVKLCLVFPAMWALSEWMRNWLFTGLPWLLTGQSQTNFLFQGMASIAGVVMISFVVAHFAGVCVYAGLSTPRKRVLSALYLTLFIVSLLYLSTLQWTTALGKPIQVSLVQANISQSLKWDPEQSKKTVKKYKALSQPLWDKSQLVIWPEAAIPTPMPLSINTVNALKKVADQHHSGLIFGVPAFDHDNSGTYNAAFAIGNVHGQYYKKHLVPFGEFFPAPAISKVILYRLNIPMSNFSRGALKQPPMVMGEVKFAIFICYEIIFGEEVSAAVSDTNANVLVVLSEDAWFGHSPAQAQQLQIAQMRAMETERYVISATNNGLTAIIDNKGKVITKAAPYEAAVLTAKVQPMTGVTPWMHRGIDILLLLSLVALFLGKKLEKRFPKLT